jgi:hypothetical protein
MGREGAAQVPVRQQQRLKTLSLIGMAEVAGPDGTWKSERENV